MNRQDEKKVFYIENNMDSSDRHQPRKKKRKWKKLKVFNILMLFLAAYFVFTIARQEFKLREIKAETVAAGEQYNQLKQEEGLINKKIADSSSTHMIEKKAKSILGWVNKDETKVIAKN